MALNSPSDLDLADRGENLLALSLACRRSESKATALGKAGPGQ